MRRILIAAALALAVVPLPGCVGLPQPTAAAIERVQARFDRLRPYAELVLPSLSPARAARVRLALELTERALAAARVATTLAEQQRALATAEKAIAVVATPTT